jgi:hypothetical protein
MIGFYIFDEQPNVGKSLVLAHSTLNENIKGYFYVRESDCSDISTVDKGSEFFGVLDDSSGFGACLFIKDLATESDAMLLQKNLHVKGNETVDGNLKVNGQITGKSTVTKLTFTADDIALLAAQITSMPGPMAAATLNHVTVEMENG